MTKIRPAESLGPVLVGRSPAAGLREEIETAARDGATVVVDFGGVEGVSPSFADELFAKLPAALSESGLVRFANVGEDLQALKRFVISGRASA